MPKICSNCGTSNRDSAVLCKKCGTKLNEIYSNIPAVNNVIPSQRYIPVDNDGVNNITPSQRYTTADNDSVNNTTPYPRYVLAGLAVLLCGVLVWFIVFRNQSESGSDILSNETQDNYKNYISSNENKSYDFSTIATTDKNDSGMEFVSNIAVVYFNKNATKSDKADVITKLNGEVVGKLDFLGQYQIKVKTSTYKELTELCDSVRLMNNVLNCTIDYIHYDDDLYYPQEGYSDRWDQYNPAGDNYAQEAIRAPEAWTLISLTQPVKVAVIDSGFDTSHDDLKRLTINPSGNNPQVYPRHGTAVAGFIGAEFNNGLGIAGIAPNALIEGYSIGNIKSTNSQIYDYVIKAVHDGNKVINISWGSSRALEDCTKTDDYYYSGWSASLLISNLLDEGKDFLIVQSAGNGAQDGIGVDAVYNGMFCSITRENCYTEKHSYEEIMDHVIIAAASEVSGRKTMLTRFSNGGSNVTICAPGANVYGLIPNDSYDYLSGTSYSAPLTTGAAAYIWGLNTYLSAADIKSFLVMSSTVQIPSNPNVPNIKGTYPFLNVGNAAMMIPPPPEDWDEENKKSDSAKLAFYDFLMNNYNNADEYVDNMPMFYYVQGDGSKTPESGNVWYQYSIADFDGDGQNELLIKKKMFMGRYGSGPPENYNYGMTYIYEWTGTDVEMYNYCTYDGELNSSDLNIYNNGVLCVNQQDTLYLYIFNKDLLSRLGMFDGEYLFYSKEEGNNDLYTRSVLYKFGGTSDTVSESEYREEIDAILTGDSIDIDIFPITELIKGEF